MNKLGVMNTRDPNAYKCCFCLHVKVGTILYGLFCLMIDIFCLGVVVLLSFHPDVLLPKSNQGRGPENDGIYVDELEQKLDAAIRHENHSFTRENMCIAYAVTLVSLMATVALLYGVIRSRPGYMVPFFCLHVFFFCMSCLTLVSYFTYSTLDIKTWMRDSGLSKMPGMDNLMDVDSDSLFFFMITMLILILCIKAYLIGMIWACYRYVQQRAIARGMTREYHIDPDTEVRPSGQMLLPPRYEDAIKTQANTSQPPPPPYTQ